MAFRKCTMILNGFTGELDKRIPNPPSPNRIAGWSETYYLPAGNVSFEAQFESLCNLRAALLSENCAIVGQRYSLVDGQTGSYLRKKKFNGRSGLQPDLPKMSLIFYMLSNGSSNKRRITCPGIPDARVVLGEYDPTRVYNTAITSFADGLIGWNFRGEDLQQPTVEVDNVDPTGIVVTKANIALVAGQYVRISRTRNENGKGKGGVFRVTLVTNPMQFTIANWSFGLCTGGRVRRYLIIFPQMNRVASPLPEGIAIDTRKVGRPFFSFTGRARRR